MYENQNNRHYEAGERQYLTMLKQISGLYGYTPEDIDGLLSEGWTLEDIEQILYGDMYGDEEEICYERIN
jgi:hypothetical protein